MLPADQRLRDSRSFGEAVRRGRRAGSPLLVAHVLIPSVAAPAQIAAGPTRVGLVVSRAVGNAVVRNLIKRRLRHEMRTAVHDVPDGSVVVLRALPAAARATYPELAAELVRCLSRATRTTTTTTTTTSGRSAGPALLKAAT